jgi:hypothetical protein
VGAQHRVLYHRVDCWGCGLETCIEQQKKCLLSITVDEVMEVVGSQLSVVGKNTTPENRQPTTENP